MATTIKSGTSAQNLDIGIPDAVNWTNPERALTSNDLHAVANFNDSTAGISHYLHVKGFGYTLPQEIMIDGIAVNVERKGTGSQEEDYYVGLVYSASGLEVTSPGKQKTGVWPSTDTTTQYGGSTDTWNRTWTADEINDANFGLALAAEGSPAQNDAAQVDFVEMVVYWHVHVIIPPSDGSIRAGGSAAETHYASEKGNEGAVASGEGSPSVYLGLIEATGGIETSGAAPTSIQISVSGGASMAGDGDRAVAYNEDGTDGLLAGAAAFVTTSEIVRPDGGAIPSGAATIIDYIGTSGGISVGEEGVDSWTYNYTPSGGVGAGARDEGETARITPFSDTAEGGAASEGEAVDEVTYADLSSAASVQASGIAEAGIEQPVGFGLVRLGGAAEELCLHLPEAPSGGLTTEDEGETADITPYWDTAEGGMQASPISFVGPYHPTGGIGTGGEADEFFVHHPQTFLATHFIVLATSYEMVPEEPDHGKKVWGHFWIMESATADEHSIHWEIWHGFDDTNIKKMQLWKGLPGESDFKWMGLGAYSNGWSNPIIGERFSITDTRKNDLLNGEYYFLGSSHATPEEFVRAQLVHRQGAKLTGAAVLGGSTDEFGSGGMECAGEAEVDHTHNPVSSGGGQLAGQVSILEIRPTRGGALAGGEAFRGSITWIESAGGGLSIAGEATEEVFYNPALAHGGVELGGAHIIGIQPAISGGAQIFGSHEYSFAAQPPVTGGLQAQPKHKQTFIDYYIMIVEMKAGGKTLGVAIKWYETHHLGYGRAMASENILTRVVYEHELQPPTDDVSPELVEDRFRMQHEPGWCDVEEKCKEGVLPKVVQKRQGRYLPPKIQRVSRRDRRIATLDAL